MQVVAPMGRCGCAHALQQRILLLLMLLVQLLEPWQGRLPEALARRHTFD